MSTITKTPTPPPDEIRGSLPEIKPEQLLLVDEVLTYFSRADYSIPETTDDNGKLKEKEKFWLVGNLPRLRSKSR